MKKDICADCIYSTEIHNRKHCTAQPIKGNIWSLAEQYPDNGETTAVIMRSFTQDDAKAGMGAQLAAPSLASRYGKCRNKATEPPQTDDLGVK